MRGIIENKWRLLCCIAAMLYSINNVKAQTLTKYSAASNAITGFNNTSYNNRPLYCNNTDAFILTGDKPLMSFVQTPFIYGSFMLGIVHNNQLKWLTNCSSIKTAYRGNMMEWTITDTTLHSLVIKLSVIPAAGTVGMCIKAQIENEQPGDKLIWMYGGAGYKNEVSLSWSMDVISRPEIMKEGFQPATCKNNSITISNKKFVIGPFSDTAKKPARAISIEGMCSINSKMKIADAEEMLHSADGSSASNPSLPIVTGTIEFSTNEKEIYWYINPLDIAKKDTAFITPIAAWQQGMERIETLSNRIVVKTPDEKLNALASASVAVIDAVWYDPVFVHGAMLWNIPFPGWRTIYGGTMYGWHDRVKKEAQYYIASQNKNTSKRFAKADTALMGTLQDSTSRFFGAGHIDKDQWVYNFQSQFFDQLITEWRSSGDIELENMLRPALELHLKWLEDCFDPDGDGVYESYINAWPTDSQWYNGGGTAEETSYAYNGHRAAAEMAMRKGDTAAANYHRKKMEQIKKGFFSKLWIAKNGFSGAYREQGGYERLHENPWLYSIFLPIDAKLVNNEQAVGSLYYTKSVLQNDKMPAGGRMVWASNWVPAVFSVRELYPGDNYHLALAYFLSGMGDDGWDIMKGTFYEGAFNGNVPGDLGAKKGGTDFNDCSSMFTRALVEGLFGYRPDYPNKKVTIAPQFPKEWNNAYISTPDFSLEFSNKQNTINASVSISKSAAIHFYFPVKVTGIKKVLVNGKPVQWKLLPGYGQSILYLQLNEQKNTIIIEVTGMSQQNEPIKIEKNIGDTIQLKFADRKIVGISDLQKVFSKATISNGILYAALSNNSGHHTLIADVITGKALQKQIIYLNITDKASAEKEKLKYVSEIPAKAEWNCVNMNTTFNGDIRTIYQQKYLSPRPNTVSARIGTDGYSAWTFIFWKQVPPIIKLDSVKYLNNDSNRIVTKQQIPFQWNGVEKNIAFTSLWDNWPKKITVSVQQKGQAIWLMAAGSTNQMQCDVTNAIIIFNYADKSRDSLSLVPPYNYWNLSPINIKAGAAGQASRGDYTNVTDEFAVPKPWPQTVQLGENCRAMLLNRKLKSGVTLESVTLQTLSQEVVVGLMGITIMK